MMIEGHLQDLEPKQSRPRLELYFDEKHRSALPRGDREAIMFDYVRSGGDSLAGR
jgi:hypothetical protein